MIRLDVKGKIEGILTAMSSTIGCSSGSSSVNVKWGDEKHDLFVKLCYAEVLKDNMPNTTLSKEGQNFVHQEFTRQAEKDPVWDLRKLKNHQDAMREDYKTFRKLKFGQIGFGWNGMTKQFHASDEWWKEKIKVWIFLYSIPLIYFSNT